MICFHRTIARCTAKLNFSNNGIWDLDSNLHILPSTDAQKSSKMLAYGP